MRFQALAKDVERKVCRDACTGSAAALRQLPARMQARGLAEGVGEGLSGTVCIALRTSFRFSRPLRIFL